jgi:Lar family restriction alleviation protein
MTDPIKEARDLLPCPFCGGHAYYNFTDAGAERKYYRVHCEKCDAHIRHPYIGKDAAREAWNTRAALDQVQNVGVDVDAMTNQQHYDCGYHDAVRNCIDKGCQASGHLQTPAPIDVEALKRELNKEFHFTMNGPVNYIVEYLLDKGHLQTPVKGLEQIATVIICGQEFIVRRENHDAFTRLIGILEPATERTGDE